MFNPKKNVKLAPYTTFHVGGKAKFFTEVTREDDLVKALSYAKKGKVPVFILGGGSNVVVSDNGYAGLVVLPKFLGKRVVKQTKSFAEVRVGAGENWDEFVAWCIAKGYFGVENLSHIPGSVGASAVQNIGAYGQEVSGTLVNAGCIDTKTFEKVVIKSKDMQLGYRASMFNQKKNKGRYVISHLTFRLKLKGQPVLGYGDIKKYFETHPKLKPNLKNIRQAVIAIRNSKFPFPDSPTKGTAGSFFKALPVTAKVFSQVLKSLKQMHLADKAEYLERMKKSFRVKQGYKIPYGVLIEALGLKGKKVGGVKVLETHAGVLMNYTGKAKAKDILRLAFFVKSMVWAKFRVKLSFEPELVGFSKQELAALLAKQ